MGTRDISIVPQVIYGFVSPLFYRECHILLANGDVFDMGTYHVPILFAAGGLLYKGTR